MGPVRSARFLHLDSLGLVFLITRPFCFITLQEDSHFFAKLFQQGFNKIQMFQHGSESNSQILSAIYTHY